MRRILTAVAAASLAMPAFAEQNDPTPTEIGRIAAGLAPFCMTVLTDPAGAEAEAERLGLSPVDAPQGAGRVWVPPGRTGVSVNESPSGMCLISIHAGRPTGLRVGVTEAMGEMADARRTNADGPGNDMFPRAALWGVCRDDTSYAVLMLTANREREPTNGIIQVFIPQGGERVDCAGYGVAPED